MFLRVVIYWNVAFTHSNTRKDITAQTKACNLPGYRPLIMFIFKGSGFHDFILINSKNVVFEIRSYFGLVITSKIVHKLLKLMEIARHLIT